MDTHFKLSLVPWLSRIQRRLPSLPRDRLRVCLRWLKANPKPWRYRREFNSGAMIVSAITLGIYAHKLTSEQTLSDWEQGTGPTASIWKNSMASFGLRPPLDPTKLHQAIRSLPMNTDTRASVWLSQDVHWVAAFGKGTNSEEIMLYSDLPEVKPIGWRQVGTGWTGFEAVLNTLEKRPSPKKVENTTKKGLLRPYTDTREVVF